MNVINKEHSFVQKMKAASAANSQLTWSYPLFPENHIAKNLALLQALMNGIEVLTNLAF